jgi:hypothetical protein
MGFQGPDQGPSLPTWQQQPDSKQGRWGSWSTRKRAAVLGGGVLVALLVVGALVGPRRPTPPVSEVPSFSPTPSATLTSAAPTVVITPSPTVVASAPATLVPSAPSTPTPTQPPTAPPTPEPTAEPTPSEEFTEFFDGTWEVGVEIPPGTYRTTDYAFGCYWARLKNFSGEVEAINANNFGDGYQVVTITSQDQGFESDDCGDWTSDLSQVTESDTEFDEGTYIVGTDIRPGTYEADASDGCYWARIKGFKGTLSEIIANDFSDSGNSIVRIRESDAGFTTSGCGTWTLRP